MLDESEIYEFGVCTECLDKLGAEGTSKVRMYLRLCQTYVTTRRPVLVLPSLPKATETIRDLERLGYITTTEQPETEYMILARVNGWNETENGIEFCLDRITHG